jgi:hypothetical protein
MVFSEGHRPMEIEAFTVPGYLNASIDIWQNSLDRGSLTQQTCPYNINRD